MTCEEAQLLMVPMWAKMPGISSEEKMAFNVHVIVCPACSKEYAETKKLMSSVKQHWGSISTETRQLLEKSGYKVLEQKTDRDQPMTIKDGWKDLCRRCPDLAENTQKPRSFQFFLRIGAVAACLVIGVLTWMVFQNYSKPKVLPQDTISQQVATVPKPSVRVELVKPSGNTTINTDQAIVTGNELKTLLINGKHRMVMNVRTSLSIEPFTSKAQLGCLVKLTNGEIYAHVQHDGNPFIVATNGGGKAVITGTVFNIKADNQQMELVVTEGTVRFENENGSVNVKAGQKSMLTANSKPTLPALCDVKMLTAWATGYKFKSILASNKSLEQVFELPSPDGWILKLGRIDYESWVREKRNWFKREFPEIFELKDCLNKEGVETDYPKLLVISGYIWQFNYPDDTQGRIATFDTRSLEKIAAIYGYDKSWLEKHISRTFLSQADHKTSQSQINISVFENWLKAVSNKSELDNKTVISSWHAAVYLIETRSLIWFAVKNGAYSLTEQQQVNILDTIQRQVDAACASEGLIRKLYKTDPPAQLCSQLEYQQLIDKLGENIESMALFEKEIAEYEICK